MEAEDSHMAQEINETQIRLKKKIGEPTVLDSFSKLISDVEKVRLNAGVKIIKHVTQDNEKVENEQSYALDRLIRGVGSSRTSAKTGFYTVLVSFLTNTSVSVEKVFEAVNKHLSTGGSNSKSENADICMGQILACGALIHSGMYAKATLEEQTKMIEMLVTAGSKRSYLSLASYTFLVELLEKYDDTQFQNILWPIMKPQITKPWSDQNLDTIYFLLEARSHFPNIVKQKFLNKTLNTPEIVHEDSVKPLCELLLNIPMLASLKHPIYAIIGKQIAESTVIPAWCLEMDQQLLRPTRNKHLVATTLLTTILENMTDTSQISDMLTPQFLTVTLNTFRNTRAKDETDDFVKTMYVFFEMLDKTLKKEDVSVKTKISVLKKLLFYPGTLIFEKITRSKLIQHITLGLNEEGVKKLAKLYKEIVTASKPRLTGENQTEHWINMDRIYAAQLLVKLVGHSSVQKEVDWRMEQAKFLLKLGLFKDTENVGVELAASLKDCFYRVLDLKLSKLEDLRNVLSSLVHYINDEIFANNNLTNLRTILPEEGVEIWQNMMTLIEKIERKKKFKDSYAVPVFHTLLLHMGLQLLSDFEMAQSALNELHSCFKRLESDKRKDEDNEPLWIEVVVDLFLSLLSQSSHLLRSVIGCVFSYLCPHLTMTALYQILGVLDPKNEENPLSKKEENDESGEESEEDAEKGSSEESDVSDLEEENENGQETATDKLRMAVRDALHKTGYQTDDESEDMDGMAEEESQRLDTVLAEAFKSVKMSKGKNMRQNKDDKALTHFRVRVLDLVEMYLDSDASMLFCLEIAIALLQILEFSIRDIHQKPLENRTRSCLKKLSAIKKFNTTDGVTETILVDMLKSILDKGSKSAFVYQDMADKIAECCIFIVRCSQLLPTDPDLTPKKAKKKLLRSPLVEILEDSLETYFNKRDSLLPISLFKNILSIHWEGNWALVPRLAEYSFNDDIRPFRRSQALELLRIFYCNTRFRTSDPETFTKKMSPVESKVSENTIELLKNLCNNPKECKVKEKFVCHLLNLLTIMKSVSATDNVEWETVGNYVREYRSHVTLAKDAKVAYNKLCRVLGIPSLVKMQLPQTNGHNDSSDEDETQSEAHSQDSTKKDKKRKKKALHKDKQKLKKEAKALRIKASSEGLQDIVFSNIPLTNITVDENTSETEETEKKPKKKKVNGDITETNDKTKKRNNSQSEDVPIKKKKKDKLV